MLTINILWEATQKVTAAKLTRLTHKIAITTAPSGSELYRLQFTLQGASPETFGYTLVFPKHIHSLYLRSLYQRQSYLSSNEMRGWQCTTRKRMTRDRSWPTLRLFPGIHLEEPKQSINKLSGWPKFSPKTYENNCHAFVNNNLCEEEVPLYLRHNCRNI